jgi:hypothetical protein
MDVIHLVEANILHVDPSAKSAIKGAVAGLLAGGAAFLLRREDWAIIASGVAFGTALLNSLGGSLVGVSISKGVAHVAEYGFHQTRTSPIVWFIIPNMIAAAAYLVARVVLG